MKSGTRWREEHDRFCPQSDAIITGRQNIPFNTLLPRAQKKSSGILPSWSSCSKAKKTRQDVATKFIHYYILCTTTTRQRIAVALVMTLHIIYFNTLMLFRFLTLLISYRKKNYAKGNGSLFLDKRIRKAVFTVTVACYRGNDIFHHFRDIP